MTIGIVDYGVGNLGSIANMLKRVGAKAEMASTIDGIEESSKIILPGIGSFGRAMELLHNSGLIPVLRRRVLEDKIPLLGICVGLQMLTERSAESEVPGLGWIDAQVKRFEFVESVSRPIPHLGWNYVREERYCGLIKDQPDQPRFYFAHSFYVATDNPQLTVLSTDYGFRFASAIHSENIYGVQFHPEKSHKFGMKLMQNFAEL